MIKTTIKEANHPYIEDSDIRLRDICTKRAKELYGETIPDEIAARINWELDAIYRTGTAYSFILHKELMEQNNLTSEDVTFRGLSCGSYILYLCGISNYNPLDFGLTSYFTFGLEKDKCIDIEMNVPTSMQEEIGKKVTDVELAYNLSHRLNIHSSDIRVDDADILSLFNSTDTLGIIPDDIEGIKYGTLGLSEFKYKFTMNMLNDVKINTFDDVVKIQGLSHGTDTWFGNAQALLEEGIPLSDIISTREDLYGYLVLKGISEKDAYRITEAVRMGKGVNEADEKLMHSNDIPQWYIESCKKIHYLFPKAHSISYALNLWKLAYFKIHYPKEFYEEYFKVYNYGELNEAISKGYDKFLAYENKRKQEYDPMKEDEDYHDIYMREEHGIRVAKEMYARGIKL